MSSIAGIKSAQEFVHEVDNPDYDEFVRRIPFEEMAQINAKLERLSPRELTDFAALVRNPRSAKIMQKVLALEETPYQALLALRERHLTLPEVATICRLHEALGHRGAELKSLPENPEYGKRMVITSGAYSQEVRRPQDSHMEFYPEHVETYFEVLIEQTAPIDLFYVIFPDDQPVPQEVNGQVVQPPTISQRIHLVGLSLFGISDELEETPVRIAASFGMMTVAIAMLTPNACLPNPVLGLSTLEDIRRGQEKSVRDMAIPFPGVNLPDQADGLPTDNLGFTYHDFAHATLVSEIPEDHRRRFMAISRAIEGGGENKLVEQFVDLDFPSYRKRGAPLEDRFWSACVQVIRFHATTVEEAAAAMQTIRAHAGERILEALPRARESLLRRMRDAEGLEDEPKLFKIAAIADAMGDSKPSTD